MIFRLTVSYSFPVYTNLFVIALCYAAIAPLVLGFCAIGLYLFYFAYRYNLMFVSNANIDVSTQINGAVSNIPANILRRPKEQSIHVRCNSCSLACTSQRFV